MIKGQNFEILEIEYPKRWSDSGLPSRLLFHSLDLSNPRGFTNSIGSSTFCLLFWCSPHFNLISINFHLQFLIIYFQDFCWFPSFIHNFDYPHQFGIEFCLESLLNLGVDLGLSRFCPRKMVEIWSFETMNPETRLEYDFFSRLSQRKRPRSNMLLILSTKI